MDEKSREEPMWKPVEGLSDQEELISESLTPVLVVVIHTGGFGTVWLLALSSFHFQTGLNRVSTSS